MKSVARGLISSITNKNQEKRSKLGSTDRSRKNQNLDDTRCERTNVPIEDFLESFESNKSRGAKTSPRLKMAMSHRSRRATVETAVVPSKFKCMSRSGCITWHRMRAPTKLRKLKLPVYTFSRGPYTVRYSSSCNVTFLVGAERSITE